jgi:hypothetical protein
MTQQQTENLTLEKNGQKVRSQKLIRKRQKMRTKIETNKQVHRAGLLIFGFIYKFEKYLI